MYRAGKPRDRGQSEQLHTFAQTYLHRRKRTFQGHEKILQNLYIEHTPFIFTSVNERLLNFTVATQTALDSHPMEASG